jgi:transcriptional regulator with XRE-family HTH domain
VTFKKDIYNKFEKEEIIMMLNENIKAIRKQRGLSQEELAIRLHVVRQTVSKWEKGLSVPDSDMLVKIAEVLEVSIGELLGQRMYDEKDKNEITEQLIRINEQFAIKNRRSKLILKIIIGILIGFLVVNLILMVVGMISFNSYNSNTHAEVQEIKE